jgi:hypothetical protein
LLIERSRRARTLFGKKFHHLFTCEYCFSHYVSLALSADGIHGVGGRLARIPDLLACGRLGLEYLHEPLRRLRLDIKKERAKSRNVKRAPPPTLSTVNRSREPASFPDINEGTRTHPTVLH